MKNTKHRVIITVAVAFAVYTLAIILGIFDIDYFSEQYAYLAAILGGGCFWIGSRPSGE